MRKIILLTVFIISVSAQAQIGGLLNKAKDKISKKDDQQKDDQKKGDQKNDDKKKSVNDTPTSTYVTDGVTSPMHQKYMNKIVFASKDESIKKQTEVEGDFKSEFNLGDPIYFRAYLDNSIFNYLRPSIENEFDNTVATHSTYGFVFYIDGVALDNLDRNVLSIQEFDNEAKRKWTTFKGALKSADNVLFVGMNSFNEILRKHDSKLTPGKHQFKMEIYPIFFRPGKGENVKGNVIASGEITLNVGNTVIDVNDPKMCMPLAVMNNEKLAQDIAKAYLRDYLVNADVVRIQSTKWEIERNKYTSVITKRTLEVNIGYKDKDGTCYKRAYLASQEHDGSKFMEDISLMTNMQNPPREISCKCLLPQKDNEATKEPVKKTTAQPKKGK